VFSNGLTRGYTWVTVRKRGFVVMCKAALHWLVLALCLTSCADRGVNRGYVISQSQLDEEVTAAPVVAPEAP